MLGIGGLEGGGGFGNSVYGEWGAEEVLGVCRVRDWCLVVVVREEVMWYR